MTTTPHQAANPTAYVVGFAFFRFTYSVSLIEKQKPDWQRGKLNGIGGKIESTDRSPVDAMRREFAEETGVCIDEWHHFHTMRFGNGATVHCFTAWIPAGKMPQTMEIERVLSCMIEPDGTLNTRGKIIPNLAWLVPMAYQELKAEAQERMLVHEPV